MGFLNNLESKIPGIVFEILGLQLIECQAHRLDVLEKSKAMIIFLTIMGVIQIFWLEIRYISYRWEKE